MKKIFLITGVTIILLQFACKKAEIKTEALSSINIVNAVVGGKTVRLNSYLRDSVVNYGFKVFGVRSDPAFSLKLFPSNNPNVPYFNQVVQIDANQIYSIFLTGTATNPEAVLSKDNIGPFSTDSTVRVRFVNLVSNSNSLKITLGSTALNSPKPDQYGSIPYKNITEFKKFDLKTIQPAGTTRFVIRNSTNDSIASYTLPATGTVSIATSRFKNITLAVKGMVGGSGTNALGVIAIPNY